jgi:hypothetical protein
VGLLLAHKRKVTLWPDLMSVSFLQEGEQVGGGKRGEIVVFSPASRYRLFRLLHTQIFKMVTFVTLTYPANFPKEARIYKANLKEFHRLFEIEFPGIRTVWRLEFQERGAPHFHLMMFDCPFIPIERLTDFWKRATKNQALEDWSNGVDIKLITDRNEQRLVSSYLSKYIAKVELREVKSDPRKAGRYWGKWSIGDVEPLEFEVSDWEAIKLVDFVLNARLGNQDWQPYDKSCCTVFGSSLGSDDLRELVRRRENI